MPDYFWTYWLSWKDGSFFGSEIDFQSNPIPPGLRTFATIFLNSHFVYHSDRPGGLIDARIYGWDVHSPGGGIQEVKRPPYTWHATAIIDQCAAVRAYLHVEGGEAEAGLTLTGWRI